MTIKSFATLTSKGQITVPAEVRKQWNLKPGDQIAFEEFEAEKITIRPRHRRSIFDTREELMLPTKGKPLAQSDIEAAIRKSVARKFGTKPVKDR